MILNFATNLRIGLQRLGVHMGKVTSVFAPALWGCSTAVYVQILGWCLKVNPLSRPSIWPCCEMTYAVFYQKELRAHTAYEGSKSF